jgi:hypothetical protein
LLLRLCQMNLNGWKMFEKRRTRLIFCRLPLQGFFHLKLSVHYFAKRMGKGFSIDSISISGHATKAPLWFFQKRYLLIGHRITNLCFTGTHTERQVSKRPVSSRPKRQVYKTSGLQNFRFTKRQVYETTGLQNVRFSKHQVLCCIHGCVLKTEAKW